MDATAADRSSRSWSARAYALCASALPGYQVVAAGGVGRPGATSRTASPACPAGKKLIGVAAGQTGLGDDGMIQALTPVEGLQSARATFSEVEAADDPAWSMTGQALCADPPPGLELVTAVSETDSDDIKSLTATCPAGKYLLGPGASVAPANGQVVIEDLRPDGTLTSVSVLGIEDATGTEEDWTLRADAVCADR